MMRDVPRSRKHRAFYTGIVALTDIILSEPPRLWLAGACGGAALALGVFAGRRHPRAARLGSGVFRLCALMLVGVVLASPSVEATSEKRFEPQGEWTLFLTGQRPVGESPHSYVEDPAEFSARVRNALVEGRPPSSIVVYGRRDEANYSHSLMAALGVPCKIVYYHDFVFSEWALGEIRGPVALQPGEPFEATLDIFQPKRRSESEDKRVNNEFRHGDVVIRVDGKEVARILRWEGGVGTALPRVNLPPGRHIIIAELLGGSGGVIQRAGHVVRVGAPPRLLAVGLDDAAFRQLEHLAPNFSRKAIEPRELTTALLRETEVVIMPVIVGVRMTSAQSRELAQFVTNGGGLYVTGDSAAQTNKTYLDATFRDLLPVRLLDQKQEPPPENPIKKEDGQSDVAAVSMVFVIDRSNTMNAQIKGGITRWHVAVESIKQALAKLDPWDRAGVLSFTLARTWRPRPKVIAPFDREIIAKDLLSLRTDGEYDNRGYNTDIYRAVQEGIEVIEQERSAVKVVVVLTDGGDRDNDDGSVRNHHELAELAISKGINIYALGIGNQFTGGDHWADSAKKVITSLATKQEFAYIAPDEDAAATAQAVFVRAVEFAYKAYDDKMKEREREKERRPVEPKDPKVDVLEGKFSLALTPVGRQLFGMRELPEPAPRLLRYARCQLKQDAALALSFWPSEGAASPVALALCSFGLGRVGFWASGSDGESLGDVAKWEDFPRLTAQTLRWLMPREDPQPRLVDGATTRGIGLVDPIEGARYSLRTREGEKELILADGTLRLAKDELPEGDGEIVERLGGQERVIGDVYLARARDLNSRQEPVDQPTNLPELKARAPEITKRRELSHETAALCLIAMLALMPLERLIRRRS